MDNCLFPINFAVENLNNINYKHHTSFQVVKVNWLICIDTIELAFQGEKVVSQGDEENKSN